MIDLKQEVELLRLYQESEGEFANAWILGLYDRLDGENPAYMAKIDRARDALDEVWIKIRAGTARVEDFKKALTDWNALHVRVLQKLGRI